MCFCKLTTTTIPTQAVAWAGTKVVVVNDEQLRTARLYSTLKIFLALFAPIGAISQHQLPVQMSARDKYGHEMKA